MTAGQAPFPYDQQKHEAEVEAWRRGRLERLTAPDSWLSLIGRFPLGEGESSVGSAEGCAVQLPADRAPALVGSLERAGERVRFTPAAGVAMTLRGRAGEASLSPGVSVEVKTDHDGPLEKLALGNVTLEVTEQPAGMFVRVRDPESAARREFAGLEHYPVNGKWRVVARLEPQGEGHVVELGYEGGSVERCESPGVAVFEIDGVTHWVEPVFTPDRKRLYLVFRDETARDATYGAGRFLYAPLPKGDHVLLDFNQAFSPPCAFTPYSACPLAPLQNRVALRIEAGEMYRH